MKKQIEQIVSELKGRISGKYRIENVGGELHKGDVREGCL